MSKRTKKKKSIYSALATGVVVAAMPATANAVDVENFKDVKSTDYFFDGVQYLVALGAISGYEDGTFKPSEVLTRAHAAKIIAEALQLDVTGYSASEFSDVAATSPYAKYIAALKDLNIISGHKDGSYKPEAPITREQLAKILVKAYDLKGDASTHTFKDVKADSEFNNYIALLVANNITNGTSETTYSPNEKVNRGQFAAFVYRAEAIAQQKEVAVTAFENGKVVTDKGTYKIGTAVAGLFSAENEAVLKNADLAVTVVKNEIVAIDELQLNDVGAEAVTVIDAGNVEITDTLTINGGNIRLKNFTANDVAISNSATGAIEFENATVNGTITVASEGPTAATTTVAKSTLTLNFINSAIKASLQSAREGLELALTGQSTLEKLILNASAAVKADKDSKVQALVIDEEDINVAIDAIIEQIEVLVEKVAMQISTASSIGNINVSQEKLKEIVTNIAQLTNQIKEVSGEPSSNVGTTPVQPTYPEQPVQPKAPFTLSLLHVNDTHGNVENAPKRVTAVKEQRALKPNSVLIDAGDVFSGTLYFNEFKGQADLKLMNLMKVDFMTFGNHEFDLGSSPEGHKALADFIKAANFPFVSANVDFSKDPIFTGLFNTKVVTGADAKNGNIYAGIVKEIEGEKVGFFGLTTAETADISSPGSVAFQDYIEQAKVMVQEFEKMGVNKIVAISHLGFDDNANVDNDQQLAKYVTGIDVIVGGHTHTKLEQPVVVNADKEPTVIVQAYQYGDFLGALDVTFDEKGVVTKHEGKLIDTSSSSKIEPDAEALEILKPYKEKIDEISKTEIGVTLTKELTNPRSSATSLESVRSNETILGNIITDGMLAKAKQYNDNVTMAFQNGGGIRSNIPAGNVTVAQVIKVLPFGNTLATMDVTGAEIKAAMEISVKESPKENGGFLHVAGAKVQYDASKPVGQRVISVQEKQADGTYKELEDDKVYTVATNAFTAKGGDGFTVFAKAYEEGRVTDLGLSDWENLQEHLISIKDAIPTEIEGRIVNVEGESETKEPFTLSLLHVNDTHGNVENAPKRVTAVKEQRALKPNSVLIDAGDVFSGTLYFNEFKGQADLKLMNLMKVDFMTFGNHEFDLGSSPEGHKALADFIKAANFPFVSANVDFSKDPIFTGLFNTKIVTGADAKNGNIYAGIVKEIEGEKVGFFGLTTAETADISSPGSVAFQDYIEQAKVMVAEFEKMGVNKIVAISHLGFDDNANVDNDQQLAKYVTGIDVIVGGHTHTKLEQPVVVNADKEPTVIVQAYQYGDFLGALDVTFDEKGVVTKHEGKLIDTSSSSKIEPDAEALEILKPYKEKIDEISKTEIGVTLTKELTNPRSSATSLESVRSNETILGNIITDGMLAKAKQYNDNVTMAFQNGGGIRSNIPAGNVTVAQVIKVLPFGNTLATMDVTGAEIKAAMEISVKESPKENGGFLHVAGAKVQYDASKPVGQRVISVQEKQADGTYKELEDDKVYTVATNAFTAKGGDGYTVFAKAYEEGRVTDLGLSDWENLQEHLISIKDAIPTEIEGRIVASVKDVEPEVKPISIAEARAQEKGSVTVQGTVVGKLKNTIQIDDGTAAISIYGANSWGLNYGDKITLSGNLTQYRNLLQIEKPTLIAKEEGEVLAPTVITGDQIGEGVESKYVQLKNVEVTENKGSGNYVMVADGKSIILRDENSNLGIEVGTKYASVSGIVHQYNNDYQVLPLSKEDLVLDPSILRAPTASNPGGYIVGEVEVTLATTTGDANIYYTLDGTEPTAASTKYEGPIKITKNTTLKAVTITNDGQASDVVTFEYEVTDKIRIHDIQGASHTSPFVNQTVQDIEGIVTYIYTLKGAQYFTIQTPDDEVDNNPHTSEGILVYAGTKAYDVKVGDKVAVTGKVSEYLIDGYSGDLLTTQINARNDQGGTVKVLSSGNELPKAFKIDENTLNHTIIDNDGFTKFDPEEDAIDFWESLESMYVEVENVKATGPQDYGDIVTVLDSYKTDTANGGVLYTYENPHPQRIQFRLEPNAGAARDFDVKTGDKFVGKINGVVAHSYTNYKIQTDLEAVKAIHQPGNATPETTEIAFGEDKLTIASYNLENFSNNPADSETPESKVQNIAKGIALGLNFPDIVGVTEVQDNDGSVDSGSAEAGESYERLIKAIYDLTGKTYAYANVDPENNKDGGAPGANIRVGFLYNTERVSLAEGTQGTANEGTEYKDGALTLNPGRIDPTNEAFVSSRKPLAAQFNFKGEKVVVIANHWNSKSGDTGLFGATQPVVLGSEVQRLKIAEIVANFVKDVKEKDANANVVALGDFNDFQFSKALKVLEDAGMENMINKLPYQDRYTYVYQGQSQVLDHILVTSNLAVKSIIDVLHVNADFTTASGRASDHDPVMIQIDFSDVIQPTTTIDVE